MVDGNTRQLTCSIVVWVFESSGYFFLINIDGLILLIVIGDILVDDGLFWVFLIVMIKLSNFKKCFCFISDRSVSFVIIFIKF